MRSHTGIPRRLHSADRTLFPAQRTVRRADGRIATRNYIGVISTVNCSASVSKYVAAHFTDEAAKGPFAAAVAPSSFVKISSAVKRQRSWP